MILNPLSAHALGQLRLTVENPVPKSDMNPGVVDRLLRENLVVIENLVSPFPSHHGKKIPHVLATLAGAERAKPVPPDRKIPPRPAAHPNPVRTPEDDRRIERRTASHGH